jgi:hypothetical protein
LEIERLEFTEWQGIEAAEVSIVLLKPQPMNRNLLLTSGFVLLSFGLFAQGHISDQTGSISSETSETAKLPLSKKVLIRLYPNPSYGKVSVTATTTEPLHFYIFDLEGTLIYQAILNNKDRKNVENLKKGTYLYDVFLNDESIEEGKIIVK